MTNRETTVTTHSRKQSTETANKYTSGGSMVGQTRKEKALL